MISIHDKFNRFIYSASIMWKLLKSNASPENTRLVFLENAMLDKSILDKMSKDPDFNMIIDDLIAFTGLSKQQVFDRLLRVPATHFKSEFRWNSPKDYNELAWFYRCSNGYLYGNSAHPYWKMLDFLDPKIGRVLDYAGGIGNNAISLAKRGFKVDYLEINFIQEAFTRFRASRHGLNNISFISPFVSGNYDPIGCIKNTYGAIILQDVLEHIPNFPVLLGYLIDHLEPNGYIIEQSPFDDATAGIDIHMKSSMSVEAAMKGMQLIETSKYTEFTNAGVWRKKLN